MPAKSAMSRKLRAGALHAARAVAFLSLSTGVNIVLAEMNPRYEPIYVYLVAVLLVAWLSSAILGVTAAVVAAILYDWFFAPVHVVPSMSFAIPATIAVAVAIATRAAHLPLRERAQLAEPMEPQPLLPPVDHPAPVDVIVDDTQVRELEEQVADLRRKLGEARMRLDDEERARAEEKVAAESREARLANEIDTLRQNAEEQRVRADREVKLREQLEIAGHEKLQKTVADLSARHETALAEAQKRAETLQATVDQRQKQNQSTAATLDALQRELDRTLASLSDEHARADREAKLRAQLEAAARETLNRTAVVSSAHQREALEAREAARAAEERARDLQRQIEQIRTAAEHELGATKRALEEEGLRVTFESAARQKLADEVASASKQLDALREELETSRADAAASRKKVAELESKREQMASDFDAKLQKIVEGITTDHENAIENAVLEREAARADARRLTQRVVDLERTIDEERRRADNEKAGREKLDAEWNDKLQKIVTHLTEDHESDIGEAVLQREAARAEVRTLTSRLAAVQKQLEEEREKMRQLIARRAAPTVEQPKPVTVNRNRPPVVLVVHSDAGVRAMAKHSLQQAGYIVLTAADGLEGLRTAAQNKPDVVIAEPVMPKMNARELIQLLKSKRETSGVKIILINTKGDIGRGVDFTADEVVSNAANFNDLRNALTSVLAS